MNYLVSARTNAGIKKSNNQDSVTVKTADTPIGKVALAVICDGMGGLSHGEIASASVISAFSDWFYHVLPVIISKHSFDMKNLIINDWNDIVQSCNVKLHEFGKLHNINLGTTCSAILITPAQYFAAHVGDSRIYEISERSFNIITEDQTFTAREVKEGRMTPEQAEADPRQSVLLQCIGASNVVVPQFLSGQVSENTVYMLCSDGFRHVISGQEIYNTYNPVRISSPAVIDADSDRLIAAAIQRGENDNITVAVVKTV